MGVISTLYWSGYRVLLIVGRFFMMYRGTECVFPLLIGNPGWLCEDFLVDGCLKTSWVVLNNSGCREFLRQVVLEWSFPQGGFTWFRWGVILPVVYHLYLFLEIDLRLFLEGYRYNVIY